MERTVEDQDYMQVAGLQCYPTNRWRDALMAFLMGIWGDYSNVMYRPKIDLGPACLRLDPDQKTFTLSGHNPHPGNGSWELPLDDAQKARNERTWVADAGKTGDMVQTMDQLVRFVKDPARLRLVLMFPTGQVLVLTKGRKRGDLDVTYIELP